MEARLLLPTRALGVCLVAGTLLACGGGGGSGDGPQSSGIPPGITYAAPTETQLAAIVQATNARDLSVRGASVVLTDDSSPFYQLRVYRHTVGGRVHYGAVTIPKLATGSSFAVLVEVDGLNQSDASMDVTRWLTRNQVFTARAVVVLPAFRGRTLRVGGASFPSEGDFCDAYDGATDDTIALMNVVEANVPAADFSRVLVRGGSRGGNVALLMGERDSRVKLVDAGSAPVDFYRRSVAELYGGQYSCQFITGKTTEQSVERMLASSPLYFPMRSNVTKVYIDHGEVDPVVPLWNANEMTSRLQARGTPVDLKVHAGAVHDLTLYASYRDRQLAIFDSIAGQ